MLDLQVLEAATRQSLDALRIINSIQTPTTDDGYLDLGQLLEALRKSFDEEMLLLVLPTAVQFHVNKLALK
jgi:hypothetical protein